MVLIDDSAPVGDVVTAIGKKMNLKNPEEFSLMTTNLEQNGKTERDRERDAVVSKITNACQNRWAVLFLTFRFVAVWLNSQKTLAEQGVDDTQGFIYFCLSF